MDGAFDNQKLYISASVYIATNVAEAFSWQQNSSLRLDEELIYQIKEFAVKSRMTQTELIKLWIIKGLSESEGAAKKGSLKDLANSVTLPYSTDSVEISKNVGRSEL